MKSYLKILFRGYRKCTYYIFFYVISHNDQRFFCENYHNNHQVNSLKIPMKLDTRL